MKRTQHRIREANNYTMPNKIADEDVIYGYMKQSILLCTILNK